MSLGKRLINTGAAAAACSTETTDIFGDSSGVALYSLDYDASDESGTYDGTPSNVDFGVGGKINYGARFNGSSSRIVVEDSSSNVFGFANHTGSISAWVNIDSLSSENPILAKRDSGDPGNRHWALSVLTDGTVYLLIYNTDSNAQTVTSSTALNASQWHHIAVTLTTTNVKIYINGVLDTTASSTYSTIQNDGADLEIGRRGKNSGHAYFDGSIDQVRIFTKSLSSSEVSTLYAETACVHTSTTNIVNYPTGTTPVAYYKLDNSSEDYAGSNDGTDTNIEYRFGRFGQAADFNGSSSKITLPTGSPFNDSNTIKAVSAWVKADTSTSRVWPLSISSTSNANDFWYIGYMGDLNRIYIAVRNGSSSNESIAYASTTTDTNWHHIFVQITATEKEIYLDGVKQTVIYSNTGTATNTSWISYPSYSGTVQGAIGVLRLSSPQYSNGFVDQIRIYNAALTDNQITELYNEKPEVDTSNFKTVLYEGTGVTQYISNVGIDLETNGGLVWTKSRDNAYDHNLVDSVRGINTNGTLFALSSNLDDEQTDSVNNVLSLDANGFTVQNAGSRTNTNNQNYVSWVFKGGGEAVNGSSSQATNVSYSANTEAGFSIVKFTSSTSTSALMNYISHGLNSPVEMTIYKRLDAANDWRVQHKDLNQDGFLFLNTTNALGSPTGQTFYDNTSTLGSIGVRSNYAISRSAPHIAYCWHSVAGYSKIGSYTGNGGSQTISVGFQPRWLMVKKTNNTGSWTIIDNIRNTSNPIEKFLKANDSIAEGTASNYVDFNSDGFTFNTSAGNSSGDTFIYLAIA